MKNPKVTMLLVPPARGSWWGNKTGAAFRAIRTEVIGFEGVVVLETFGWTRVHVTLETFNAEFKSVPPPAWWTLRHPRLRKGTPNGTS